MPFWTFGSVEEQPQVRLVRWRVLEASYSDRDLPLTRHLVGADATNGTGRVSSAIQQIDAGARRCLTRSGRAYGLLGESRYDNEAEYVWSMWCSLNDVVTWTDVTEVSIPTCDDDAAVPGIKPVASREAP